MTQLVRYTLWASAPFNVLAAYMLAFPSSALGRLVELPADVPPAYAALLSFMVLLFGAAYAWLASQPEIHRPLLGVGAIGKAGVFAITVMLWLSDHGSGRMVLLACGDLGFATLWFRWLLGQGRQAPS
jgi:hypothetical protein